MGEYTDERLVDYLLGLERDPELEEALRGQQGLRERCRTLRSELNALDHEAAHLIRDEVAERLARCSWRILLAVDESSGSRAATVAAAGLALRTDGVVDVLHVRPVELGWNVPLPPESRAEATAIVCRALGELHDRGVSARGQVLSAAPSQIVRHILSEAEEIRADIVVLGASSRSLLSALSSPRVAVGVARRAPCPVLVVR
jgi:nucleotide-binding universal stress UspA family protein